MNSAGQMLRMADEREELPLLAPGGATLTAGELRGGQPLDELQRCPPCGLLQDFSLSGIACGVSAGGDRNESPGLTPQIELTDAATGSQADPGMDTPAKRGRRCLQWRPLLVTLF